MDYFIGLVVEPRQAHTHLLETRKHRWTGFLAKRSFPRRLHFSSSSDKVHPSSNIHLSHHIHPHPLLDQPSLPSSTVCSAVFIFHFYISYPTLISSRTTHYSSPKEMSSHFLSFSLYIYLPYINPCVLQLPTIHILIKPFFSHKKKGNIHSKPKPMEDTTLLQDFEDSEDALSFCDLPIDTLQSHDSHHHPDPSPDDHFFEFLSEPIIISGRTLPPTNHPSVDLATWRSESFSAATPSRCRTSVVRSESLRLSVPKGSSQNQPGFSGMRVTPAARSKKHAFMFGLPKFPLEMELSDMRRRQNRRAPAPIIPVAEAREAAAGGKSAGKGQWGLLRSLRCRANLLSAFGRAGFSCVSPVL